MRGLVEETKKSKLGTTNTTTNNNNNNNNNSSSSSMGSRGKAALTSASSSRPLKGGGTKTPTTTTAAAVATTAAATGVAAKKLPQVGAKSKAAATATTSSSSTAGSSGAKPGMAKAVKASNPTPQASQIATVAVAAATATAPASATPQQAPMQPYNNNSSSSSNNSNSSTTITLPKASHANTSEELAGGVQDTIYLCNFRVSVDGEWLCLKELQDIDVANGQKTVGGGAALLNTAASAAGVGGGGGNGGVTGVGGAGHVQHRTQSQQQHHQFGQRNSKRFSGLSTGSAGGFEDNARDTAEIERSNLVNICKLVVKELLEQSLRYGRMLDSDHLPLQHFFIVIEHVLGHGLRPKKGLLGPRKELWDLLQSVENYCPEAQDITASVRDLPTVRTHIGRARAWLRIALMQKKLSDYLQALIEHREDSLFEYYEPHALMMSDEIVVIMGILVGLNVIDCNLCVKEEDLDSQQGVIDFSLYLRSSSRNAEVNEESNAPVAQLDDAGQGNMIAVLDQKNYIEELNRHLNATVGNLQAKVESLTTTNALMKEDLAIARNSLLALQAENQAMRQSASQQAAINQSDNSSTGSGSDKDKDKEKDKVDGLNTQLAEERKRCAELEKELNLQISLKAESDMAMKLLEKDIHEKQDTIVSLRRQLDDIKQINLEMYRKLQDCNASLTHKTELMSKLECQKEDMASTIEQLEKKWTNDKSNLGEILKTTSQTLSTQVSACEERAARAEAETRIEREWRVSLQEKELKLKEKIATLQMCVKELNEERQKNEKLKLDLEKVRAQWSEAQTTLEELGIQLSVSKLKISEFQDNERRQLRQQQQLLSGSSQSLQQTLPENPVSSPGIWAPDSIATHCTACTREFNLTRRKHHCRSCGEIFCKACSEHTLPLLNAQGQPGRPVRVCNACYTATSGK
ncbi:PREDICTED: RUN and FYVE domain-containing protein 2 isoform X3 [Drosophila arizonae]|uniref:RUN and FYVE domain-containing protein 2 isoform X3 n=1 Tax=Drosophila arizonae TaxID=7263 RepID=A0ABM1PP85_DROAR|nr:PREDICTED: RUN and FYVE domain-containing protein 2 isoform X3 [Drosophila arizonae]